MNLMGRSFARIAEVMLTVGWTTRDLDADPLHLRPIRDEDLEFILGLYQDGIEIAVLVVFRFY